jgi:stage II sporulation protein D
MRKFIFINLIWIFIALLQPAAAAGADEQQFVKIGLATDESQIILNVADAAGILDISSPEPQSLPISGVGDQLVVNAVEDQLVLNYVPVGLGSLLILPGETLLSWNAHHYRGGFMITAKNSRVTLINYLPLDDYLKGVVPREVMADWPLAVLKAQAIAARTFAIASLKRHAASGFDLCPSDHCQVYGGADAEKPNSDLAVTATSGEVITYRGRIISALYHSSSGGFTLDAADVWNQGAPYLKPVLDWDQNSPYNQWTKCLQWEDLQGLTARSYPALGTLRQILPLAYGPNGMLLKISLRGDLAESTINGEQFRSLAGLPSAKVQIAMVYGPEPLINLWWMPNNPYPEAIMASRDAPPGLIADVLTPPWNLPDPWAWLQDKQPLQIVLRGSGWGHGVGMSQWGAKGMADAGYNERQILEHYYPGAAVNDMSHVIRGGNGAKK